MIQPPTVGPSVGAREDSAPMRGGGDDTLLAVEEDEGGGEHRRDHRAAEESLQRAEHDHAVDVPGPAAQQAGEREPAADTQNSQRVDITRDSQPDSGMTMISAIR